MGDAYSQPQLEGRALEHGFVHWAQTQAARRGHRALPARGQTIRMLRNGLRGKRARIAEKVERRVGAATVAKADEIAVASDEAPPVEATVEAVTETAAETPAENEAPAENADAKKDE